MRFRSRARATSCSRHGTSLIAFARDRASEAMRDLVTIRNELERRTVALADASRSAEEASEAKSRFLAAMSHEIRTPLNGVVGMIDLLERTPLDDVQRRYCDTIRSSAHVLRAVVDDILDFSKIEAGRIEIESVEFSPAESIEQARRSLAVQADKKGVFLRVSVDPCVPSVVRGDPTRFQQILINLLSNALKFTEKGGVLVRCVAEDMGGHAAMRISVNDSGIGVPLDRQNQLFHPFIQAESGTTRRFGGSGLGLAICRQLVELMGGEIGVESEPGMGSTFWFKLPLRAEQGRDPAVRSVSLLSMRYVLVGLPAGSRLAGDLVDLGLRTVSEPFDRAASERLERYGANDILILGAEAAWSIERAGRERFKAGWIVGIGGAAPSGRYHCASTTNT